MTAGPPPVPSTGAYLGAWLQPVPAGGTDTFAAERQALPGIQAALGHPLALVHVYTAWQAPAPIADLVAIDANGSMPILDWGCAPDGAAVASGAEDGLITAYAQALKDFGHPVLLRWCWEMNLAASHPGVGGPQDIRGHMAPHLEHLPSSGRDQRRLRVVSCGQWSGSDALLPG